MALFSEARAPKNWRMKLTSANCNNYVITETLQCDVPEPNEPN